LKLVTGAMMLAMTVSALEMTVVSTAMPKIIAELHGGEIYPWVFSAYLLAATVSTPIYGKLADLWGRKRLLLFGLALFGLGSMLSGMAQSMGQLIAMRVVQGVGAGAVMPIVLTILGDIYTLEQRARVQSLFSTIWGIASVAGPLLGGWLTDNFSWRWVFFVTVPFGLVAMYVLEAHFREKVEARQVKPIDWWGALLLTGATTALLLAFLGWKGRPWEIGAALGVAAVVFSIGFVWWERRAADPIVPIDLMTEPAIFAAVAGSFLVGAIMFALDTYVPLYVQGVLGQKATRSGSVLMPMFLTWAISVAIAAKFVIRRGYRAAALVGTSLVAAGMAAMTAGAAVPASAEVIFAAGLCLIGLGMGPISLSYILSVQHAVPWGRRGVATSAVTFTRTIGGALGVALLGAALGAGFSRRLPGLSDLAASLSAEALQALDPSRLLSVRQALGVSLRDVFALTFVAAASGLLCAMRLPAGRASGGPGAGAEVQAGEDALTAAVVLE
jgi:EmrB/QacA subfamily drug resistance transporter